MALNVMRAKADSEISSTGVWDVFYDCHVSEKHEQIPRWMPTDRDIGTEVDAQINDYLNYVLSTIEISSPQDHTHITYLNSHWITKSTQALVGARMGLSLQLSKLLESETPIHGTFAYMNACETPVRQISYEDWIESVEYSPQEMIVYLDMSCAGWVPYGFKQPVLSLPAAGSITVQPEVARALRTELSDFLPSDILVRLIDLAQESFDSIRAISFTLEEDPEIPDDKKICMRIDLGGSVEEVSEEYDTYVDSFVERFSPDISCWITTALNIV